METYYFAATNLYGIPLHIFQYASKIIPITYTYHPTKGFIFQRIAPSDDLRYAVAFLNPEPELHTYLMLLNVRLVHVEDEQFIGLLERLFVAKEYEEIYE